MAYLGFRLRVGTAFCATVAALGCSNETGILVVVDRDDTVPAEIDHLEFAIGVPDNTNGDFTLDVSSSVEVPMEGRDVKVSPFELLVHPNDPPTPIVVIVTAWDGQGQVVGAGGFAAPQPFIDGKVLRSKITLAGFFDGYVTDTGCVKFLPPGEVEKIIIAPANDRDCDGDATTDTPPDCNDMDSSVGPSMPELCETTDVDEDCDGDPIEDVDGDTDGQTRCLGDCDDTDPDVNSLPDTVEICDGKDNDCNLQCDELEVFDVDGDGYTQCDSFPLEDGTCVHGKECDDATFTTHEGAPDLCDGVDNDCNGVCDDGDANDVDLDGFTPCGTVVGMCNAPTPLLADCQPEYSAGHPFADELCDGVDTNCDDLLMPGSPCFVLDGSADPAGCVEGFAGCDDDGADGSFGLEACSHGGTGESRSAPDTVCESYAACETAGEVDPWVCSLDSVPPVVSVSCTVKVTGPLNTVCASDTAPMNGAPVGSLCSWRIYGGVVQDHYDVGVSNALSPFPSAGIDTCPGTFHVTNRRDPMPQDDTVWLGYSEGTDTPIQLVRVDLVPMSVPTCPAVNGLECTIAIP
jgi:hypothetical protein